MNNDFKIIKYDSFEDYIGAIVKLSNKDIHRKMVEQYEDHYLEHGHDWGYGEIEKHNIKPGVLFVNVQKDGVEFVTEEFSFDEDLYREALEQLKTSYLELHRTSPATYLESTLKDCLKGLSEAKKRIDTNPYFSDYPYFNRTLQEITTKLKSDFEHLSGQEFKTYKSLDSSLPDPEEVAKLFIRQGRSNEYGRAEVVTVMKITQDFIKKEELSDIYGYAESLYRDAKQLLVQYKSTGKISRIPARNTILSWIKFYAKKAGVVKDDTATHKDKDESSIK